ncbi:MAG: type II toxin-antitoxin system VapC family toxin [Pacificibacter sp.]
MIFIDTSALMALLLGEPEADEIAALLGSEESLSISAGTLAEALIVAERRGLREDLAQLLEGLSVDVDEVGAAGAVAVAQAYSTWGKGVHPAGLNFGDCFAYATAKASGARLLFVGDDFAKTDVVPAL